MVKQKDLEILAHLRKDARKKVTEISRKLKMPVTTVYDRLRAHLKRGIVKKHVALVDFSKLGYTTTALIALKVSAENKDSLKEYLSQHYNINSLYRVDFGYDFLCEIVVKNASKLREFVDFISLKFNIKDPKIFNILDEIKKESFLSETQD